MQPYRNEIPHSVAGMSQIYASESISVIKVGMTSPEPTVFDAMCFVVTEGPAGKLIIDGKRFDLQPGTFVPVNPQQPGRSDAFRRLEGAYVVCADPACVEEIGLALFDRASLAFPNRPVPITSAIRELLSAYIAESEQGPAASKFLLATCSTTLIGCLLREAACNLIGAEMTTVRRTSIRNAVEFLRDNLAADCRLAEVAQAANMSPFHLIRLFKSETGKTPHEYLVHARIAKAKQLLASRRLTVKEVAYRCGFQEAGSLSRIFREKVGVSPSEYRSAGGAQRAAAVFDEDTELGERETNVERIGCLNNA